MSSLLLLKLTLAPALVAVASLLGRRYGARVSGWLAGFPIVAGPVLIFYALEQGPDFAARAAISTLEGLLSLCAFCLAYVWRGTMHRRDGREASAFWCLLTGYVAFAFSTLLLNRVSGGLWKTTLWALLALYLARKSFPKLEESAASAGPGRWDLPARVASTAALVLTLTYLADKWGPHLSGLLTPFPVAGTVLTVFAHLQGGIASASSVLKGFLAGLNSFAVFLALFAACIPGLGLGLAFVIGLAGSTLLQAALLWWMQKEKTAL